MQTSKPQHLYGHPLSQEHFMNSFKWNLVTAMITKEKITLWLVHKKLVSKSTVIIGKILYVLAGPPRELMGPRANYKCGALVYITNISR